MLGAAIVLFLVVVAILAPVIQPYDPEFQQSSGLSDAGSPLGPSSTYKLGTDPLGRDELSRLIDGARLSLTVGIAANVLAAVIGLALGGAGAMARRSVQTLAMRMVDVILSFPILLLAIALLSVVRPSVETIVLITGVSFGAYLSRLVFAQATSLREREFVLAARTAGVGNAAILVRHIIPHVLPTVVVFCTLGVAAAIQLEAGLSYVGIGIQVPQASWGNMINDGQHYIATASWLVLAPGAAIMLAVLGFSLLGDGLRDALDPTLERRGTWLRGTR